MKKNFLTAAAIFLGGMSLGTAQTIPTNVTMRDFFPGVTFARPVAMIPFPGRDSAFVVVEQAGNLQLVQRSGNAWVKSLFVNVPVSGGTGGEDGLLGFAFHPNYTQNRKYYTFFLRNSGGLGDNIAERFARNNLLSDSGLPERILLRVADPASNHNGGTIAFGTDGFLYISIGDGGPQNDPDNRAQNRDSLLGKILRIDVNSQAGGLQYAIPASNPFVGQSGREEIWALGFRNPYKWSFHPTRGEMWVGDVGQDAYEEVSLVPRGGNMGWKVREGMHCRPGGPGTCSTAGLIDPVVERPQANNNECAVIGGVFFRGDPTAAFHDLYFFGDNCSGEIWAMRVVNGANDEDVQVATLPGLSSFANDSHGRVFVMSVNSNTIRVLESPDMRMNPTAIRPSQGQKPLNALDLNQGKYDLKTVNGRKIKSGKKTGLIVAEDKDGKTPARLVPAVW